MHSITIYSSEFRVQWPESVFDRLLAELPEACRKRALAAGRWQDGQAIAISRHLLKRALEDAGIPTDLHNLRYSSFGRPFLENGPEFNWSHSGNKVVCAISRDSVIGIDIEYIRPLKLSDFQNSFAFEEWDRIISSEDPIRRFYGEWTVREAVLKADGRGLPGNMRNVKRVDGTEMMLDNGQWFIHEVGISQDYACHLASKLKMPAFSYREIDIVSA